MPTYVLSPAWLKIASAGQAVAIQNQSTAPLMITTSLGPPAATDGLVLDPLDARSFALTADLYARSAGAAAASIEVFGGFTLPGTTGVAFAIALPVISGVSQVGRMLSASPGTWTGSPTAYAYQWARNGAAIIGATNASYTVVLADIGLALSVTVTATNAAGSATATGLPTVPIPGSAPGGGSANTADFSDPNNAYLAALAA